MLVRLYNIIIMGVRVLIQIVITDARTFNQI